MRERREKAGGLSGRFPRLASGFGSGRRHCPLYLLGHRHLLRQCARPKVLRSFSSTSRVDLPTQTEGGGEEKGEGEWSAPKDPTWAVWKKTIGKQFEEPRRPCNWLGGKVVEFVSVWQRSRIRFLLLNPVRLSALPVKPILPLRNTLYQSFMANPEANSVRSLASRYHLSIKRVDAILRLKGLEESWIKVCPPLPSFSGQILAGMMFTRLVLKTSKMVIPYVSPDLSSHSQG
jgi:hypothetical protein